MGADPRLRTLARARWVFALLVAIVPLGLVALFERQAKRLDALTHQGVHVTARVTRVARGGTHYSYRVRGVEHSWNVARAQAPYAPGETFDALYLPSEPTLSRPHVDRERVDNEAAHVRAVGRKVALAIALTLLVFVYFCHDLLVRARRGELSSGSQPRELARRLKVMALAALPMLVLVFSHHKQDALERGASRLQILETTALAVLLPVGVYWLVSSVTSQRMSWIKKWVRPTLALVVALFLAKLMLER